MIQSSNGSSAVMTACDKKQLGFGGSCCLSRCWLADWLTSQQHASVSQVRICSDNYTCCHTEIEDGLHRTLVPRTFQVKL